MDKDILRHSVIERLRIMGGLCGIGYGVLEGVGRVAELLLV